ncbi:hypothetical protein B0H14DRAFT_3144843 [Mycena olivaceomarginata]|nr:hypothetical protein B0H14DRAFT_3144843 [Mycena olivaceomarginata]
MIIILETDSTYNEMKKVVTLQLCLLNQFKPAFSTIGLTFILWNASHTHQGFTEIRIRFFALLRRTLRVSAPYEPSIQISGSCKLPTSAASPFLPARQERDTTPCVLQALHLLQTRLRNASNEPWIGLSLGILNSYSVAAVSHHTTCCVNELLS